jgi:hypothetical protein
MLLEAEGMSKNMSPVEALEIYKFVFEGATLTGLRVKEDKPLYAETSILAEIVIPRDSIVL